MLEASKEQGRRIESPRPISRPSGTRCVEKRQAAT